MPAYIHEEQMLILLLLLIWEQCHPQLIVVITNRCTHLTDLPLHIQRKEKQGLKGNQFYLYLSEVRDIMLKKICSCWGCSLCLWCAAAKSVVLPPVMSNDGAGCHSELRLRDSEHLQQLQAFFTLDPNPDRAKVEPWQRSLSKC